MADKHWRSITDDGMATALPRAHFKEIAVVVQD